MSLNQFGKRLRTARLNKKLSQRSLGLSIGLSDKTISSYESGRSYPTLDVLEKIAGVLGRDMDFFVCKDDINRQIDEGIKEVRSSQEELDSKIERLVDLVSKGV